MSKKTIQKKTRVRSAKANFCPRCHKRFSRLDTHLRTSAKCRHIPTKNNSSNGSDSCFPPCQEHSTLSISGNSSESSQLPSASVTITSSDEDSSCFPPAHEFSTVTASESLLSPQPRPDPPQPSPAPAINSPVPSVKPRLYLPRLDDEWKKANTFFETELVPCVLNEASLEHKYTILVDGIYSYFAAHGGTRKVKHRNTTRQNKSVSQLRKAKELKNAARRELAQASDLTLFLKTRSDPSLRSSLHLFAPVTG